MMTRQSHLLVRLTTATTLASAAASTLLGACATNESASLGAPDASVTITPEEDAGAVDADADADACTSSDCAYFPSNCTSDALCPSGLFNAQDPFDRTRLAYPYQRYLRPLDNGRLVCRRRRCRRTLRRGVVDGVRRGDERDAEHPLVP